ncbi:MAG TPA: hypothetical protein DCL32_00305 [Gammaproteobacteria bacterium]|nr:hypothetical protein [Gammaproteobacteria bacterium]
MNNAAWVQGDSVTQRMTSLTRDIPSKRMTSPDWAALDNALRSQRGKSCRERSAFKNRVMRLESQAIVRLKKRILGV